MYVTHQRRGLSWRKGHGSPVGVSSSTGRDACDATERRPFCRHSVVHAAIAVPILALWPAQAQNTIQSGPRRRPTARLRGTSHTSEAHHEHISCTSCRNRGISSRFLTILSVGADLGSTGASVVLTCTPVVAGADLGPLYTCRWYLALCLVPSRWHRQLFTTK